MSTFILCVCKGKVTECNLSTVFPCRYTYTGNLKGKTAIVHNRAIRKELKIGSIADVIHPSWDFGNRPNKLDFFHHRCGCLQALSHIRTSKMNKSTSEISLTLQCPANTRPKITFAR